MSIMMRKKVCGIMIISALNISSASGDGPSCSSSSVAAGPVSADEDTVDKVGAGIFDPLKQATFSYEPPLLLFGYLYERFM
ncbi:hypothetical protein JVU11DRAFT_1761 [Chiua virens]|nr:hypothetical protein JVU11DRAFT_1761 [Chiua virens]